MTTLSNRLTDSPTNENNQVPVKHDNARIILKLSKDMLLTKGFIQIQQG